MVRIAKGNLIATVTNSAFDNFFKSQGWDIVEGDYTPPVPVEEEKVIEQAVENSDGEINDEEINDDEWDEALDELNYEDVEKPLSEMNKVELLEKAKSLKIDVSDLNTNKQLREAIKAAL